MEETGQAFQRQGEGVLVTSAFAWVSPCDWKKQNHAKKRERFNFFNGTCANLHNNYRPQI